MNTMTTPSYSSCLRKHNVSLNKQQIKDMKEEYWPTDYEINQPFHSEAMKEWIYGKMECIRNFSSVNWQTHKRDYLLKKWSDKFDAAITASHSSPTPKVYMQSWVKEEINEILANIPTSLQVSFKMADEYDSHDEFLELMCYLDFLEKYLGTTSIDPQIWASRPLQNKTVSFNISFWLYKFCEKWDSIIKERKLNIKNVSTVLSYLDQEWKVIDFNTESKNDQSEMDNIISAEKWVELYGDTIKHYFISNKELVSHIMKLRLLYEDAKTKNGKKWKSPFLRDNVCGPKVSWLSNPQDISIAMIDDLFGSGAFSDDQLSRSKKRIMTR